MVAVGRDPFGFVIRGGLRRSLKQESISGLYLKGFRNRLTDLGIRGGSGGRVRFGTSNALEWV